MAFDVGEYHVEFGLFKDHESCCSSFSCYGCDVVVFEEFLELVEVHSNDPYKLHYVSLRAMA